MGSESGSTTRASGVSGNPVFASKAGNRPSPGRGRGPGGPGGGLTNSQSPPFTVPIRYMLLGMVGFVLFAIDLVIQSVSLSHSMPLVPVVVSLTHILTLGSLLSFVMGAVYQLSTVAFLIPLTSVTTARRNFWLYAVGIIGLIVSMADWWRFGLLLFGSLVTLSLYIYVGIILSSVRKTTVKGPVVWFVQWAHVFLALAITDALLLILSFGVVPALGAVFQELLWTHIILATGFFTFLILGFSYKLLPMFTLSHGFSVNRQPWTFGMAISSVVFLLGGVWLRALPLVLVGGVLGLGTFVNQGFDFRGIYKKRLRKRTEAPMISAMGAVVIAAIALVGLVALLFGTLGFGGWQGFVTFYLLGWVTLTVMSYAYKIVPFLIWTKRYSVGVEQGKTPLIKDMIDVDRARPVLILFVAGLLLLAVTGAIHFAVGTIIGSLLCAIAVAWFFAQIVRVVDVRRLPRELITRD